MNKKEREKFRRTSTWQKTRAAARAKTNIDYITKEYLTRLWELHHLDLNVKRYDQVDDLNKFLPLNPTTHDFVHFVYKIWKKDKGVLKRLETVLEKMEMYTNDKE